MINKAVESLVRERFGEATWHKIRTRAGVPDEPFVSMQQYPDESTYRLVGAASEELGAAPEAILREFGRYWMDFAGRAGYGEILRSSGRTLPEFLRNLDPMHSRLQMQLGYLRAPSFVVSDETPQGLVLHYHSERAGLAPLVMGILDALALRFQLELSVRHVRDEGARPHDIFHLAWRPAAVARA